MTRKYISKTQFSRSIVWLPFILIPIILVIWFWIYSRFYTSTTMNDNWFKVQSFDWEYCLDVYDYLDTDNIWYYKWYTYSQLMFKNMQDLSTLMVYAENNKLPVNCPDGKVCDLNKDSKIDGGDLWFLEQLIRDIGQDDKKLIEILVSHGLPVDCD